MYTDVSDYSLLASDFNEIGDIKPLRIIKAYYDQQDSLNSCLKMPESDKIHSNKEKASNLQSSNFDQAGENSEAYKDNQNSNECNKESMEKDDNQLSSIMSPSHTSFDNKDYGDKNGIEAVK